MSIIMRYANEDLDKDNLFWKARLTKNFELETLFEVSEKFGSKKRSVQLILDNRDQELTALHESYSLLNKAVVLYYDDPAGTTKTFTGVVTELNKMGLDVEITVGEQFSLYMQQPIPDLQVAVDYYSDKGINENWNAAPIIIGNVNRLKTQWVDLVYSRYIIGSGPLASIDKVYFDDVIMYDKTRSAAENIFQTSDSAKKVGVIIWRGTGWEDDPETQTHPVTSETVTSVYPGVAYLEFYNPDAVDGYGNPSIEGSAPVNADGSACEVYVDVKGISDPDTEPADPQPERNPAKILYQLATNPVTSNDHAGFDASEKGARGFGLAIDPTDIDFDDAISFCATNNIVIDGVIAQRKEASEWFDELAKYCMATFKEIDGVFTLILDTAATEIKAHFSDTGINAYECVIGDYSEPSYDKQINRVRLYYGYNVETDKFDKRPSGSEESPISANSQYLRNESHYLKLLKWNTDKYEYKFVQDDTTAHKIAQYNFKRNILQLKTVDITIGFDTVDLDVLDVISVTSTKHSWDRKQFRIKKIVRGDKGIKLTCLEYDSNVYTDECSGTISITPKPYLNTPRPDKAILNSVTQRVDIAEDGAANVILIFDFDLPENASYVNIHYKEYEEDDPSPDTGYEYLGSTGNSPFELKWLYDLDKKYRIRLVSVAGDGSRSFISITGTDKHYIGQPGEESYIEIVGDSEAPGKPIVTTTPIPYGVVLGLSITGGTPADFSHYEIYRKIEDGELEVINANVKTQLFTDVNNEDLPYDRDIQYQIIAYDNSGNASVASDLTAAVQVKFIVGDDITGEPIIAKDFRTSAHVGDSCSGEYVSGVKFDKYGIQGYNSDGLTFNLDTSGDLYLKGEIEASSGKIGGWTISEDSLYAETTGTIKTSSNVGCGYNGVILDKDGLRGYDSVLGMVFNLPSNGDAPTFSSGIINESIFEISTNSILRTSTNAVIGSCGVGEAGVLINNSGIYASDDTTVGAENAKVRLLSNGEFYLQSGGNLLSWDGSNLNLVGDLEMASNGNLLPDPAFDGIPFCNTLSDLPSSFGEYSRMTNTAFACVQGVSKDLSDSTRSYSNGVSFTLLYSTGWIVSNHKIPVKENQEYTFSLYASSEYEPSAGTLVQVYITWYKSDGTTISSEKIVNDTIELQSLERYYGTTTAPADTAFATFYVKITSLDGTIYVSALQLEEGNTHTAWKNKAGKITANQIVAGELTSLNLSTSAGSCLNLNDGTFKFGGTSSPALSWDGSTLYVEGTICSCSGNISGWSMCDGSLYSGTCGTHIELKPGCGIWAGATLFCDAPFSVSNTGKLKATNATISGTSYFGKWTLDDDYLFTSSRVESVSVYTCDYSNLTSQFSNVYSRVFNCSDDSLNCMYSASLSSTTLSMISYDCNMNITNESYFGSGYVKLGFLAGCGNRAVYSDSNGYLTNSSSDIRLKNNICLITNDLNIKEVIFGLTGIYFNWIDTKRGTLREIGLIAQEVQKYIPEAVGENFDGYLSLDYSRLIPVLIESNKDLYCKIAELECKLTPTT